MATGWAGDGAVQDQIDATVKDAISRVQSQLPKGPSLVNCAHCAAEIPEARRIAIVKVRLPSSDHHEFAPLPRPFVCLAERTTKGGGTSPANKRSRARSFVDSTTSR